MKSDLLETSISLFVGIVINAVLTVFIFNVSVTFALGSTAVFTVFSFLRMFILRRVFRKIENARSRSS